MGESKAKVALKAEEKEEKWLLNEYYYLERLKRKAKSKDENAGRSLARKLGRSERKLEVVHKKVLNLLHLLIIGYPKYSDKVKKIESSVNVFSADLKKELSALGGEVTQLIKDKKWDELADSVIAKIEKDIKGWEALDEEVVKLEVKLAKKEKKSFFGRFFGKKKSEISQNNLNREFLNISEHLNQRIPAGFSEELKEYLLTIAKKCAGITTEEKNLDLLKKFKELEKLILSVPSEEKAGKIEFVRGSGSTKYVKKHYRPSLSNYLKSYYQVLKSSPKCNSFIKKKMGVDVIMAFEKMKNGTLLYARDQIDTFYS
jgi:hypothetical protein